MAEPNKFNVSPEKNYKYYIKEDLGHRITNVSNSSMHHRNKSFDLILNNQYHQNRESLASNPKIGKCILSGWGSCKSYPSAKNLNVAVQYLDTQTCFKSFEEDIISIAPSDSHLLILTSTGKVYACGRNEQSQLGGNFGPVNQTPGQLEFPYKAVIIEKISVGSDFNFAMSNKAEVFCWGFNMRGQQGVGHYENITTPTLVQSLTKSTATSVSRSSRSFMKKGRDQSFDIGQDKNNESQLGPSERVIQIECGGLHTLALTNRNRVFASGFGDTYALGLDKPETICTFNEISWFAKNLGYTDNIEKIACGVSHSGCIAGGKVYLWGILGLNSQLHFKTPYYMSLPNKAGMTSTSNVNISKDNMNLRKSQKSMLVSNEPSDLKLGDLLTVVMTKKGEIYTLGENSFGQLGDSKLNSDFYPNFLKVQALEGTDIMSIAVGNNHVLAFERETRNVYGWGNNAQGQIIPGLKDENIENPKLITSLKGALISKMFAGPHTTFCFSKNAPDFGLAQSESNNQSKGNPEIENKLQTELESLRKLNGNLSTDNERLKGDFQGLNTLMGSLEKEKVSWVSTNASTKRGFFSNAATQTTNTEDGADKEMFDVMQHFKKKLKIDRTLKPDFEIDFNELTIEKRIGEGGFGIIYRARWRESTIAVKVLKPDLMREETIKDFQNECYAMESLRHPNICMFMGACTKLPNLAIVLEYCSKETLWKLLQNKEIHLTWEDNRRIAVEIARGMNYLHTFAIPVIHRDLKSLNILMDEGYRPKIADFGWTRKVSDKMTGKIGTYQWMAPEVIKSQKYTEKADVFSFGIILWEIASREPPYRNVGGAQVSQEVVNNDLRPNIPKSTPESFAKLMKKCWDRNSDKRPNFKDIIREVETMKLPKY